MLVGATVPASADKEWLIRKNGSKAPKNELVFVDRISFNKWAWIATVDARKTEAAALPVESTINA